MVLTRKLTTLCAVAGLAVASIVTPAIAAGKNAGDWLIRGRVIAIAPGESSTISAIGGEAKVDTAYVPELDISYFFTDNIAAELVLATTEHDAEAVGTTLGTVDLGDVWLLPPTLSLQYHFAPDATVSPYVGGGINWTLFYNADAPGTTVTDTSFSNSFGPALQAGVDIQMSDTWMLNLDIKKVWLDTDVSINGGAISADLDIDPWIFGVGIGRTF